MKKIFQLFLFVLIISSLHACVVLSSKKYKALLSEKDSLAAGWDVAKVKIVSLQEEIMRLKADTARLYAQIADLQQDVASEQNDYAKLKATHAALIANSSSEIKKISEELSKRESRLREVEELLRKRDEATQALRKKLEEALLGFTDNGLSVEVKNGKVYVFLTDKLLFSTGSIVIDQKGEQALQELAKVLKTRPDLAILVEGHTDNQQVRNLGQIKDNWDLSVLRATSVVRYLTETQKLESVRLTASGRGEYQPIDKDNTADARSRNRRIEIVLSPKLDELFDLIKQ